MTGDPGRTAARRTAGTGTPESSPRGCVSVHVHGSLKALVGPRQPSAADVAVERRFDVAPSVKDVVEGVGIPHPEIGAVGLGDRPVGWGEAVADGARLDVYPADEIPPGWPAAVADPPRPVRFAADVHLAALARRLRMLGFDVRFEPDADDDALARWSIEHGRVLLTRDRGLLKRSRIRHGYIPRSDRPDDQAVEVVGRFGLAGDVRPSTRCPSCNGRLEPASPDDLGAVPPQSREAFDDFRRCPACGQVYWRGSHAPHLDALEARAREAGRPPPAGE